MTPIFIFFKNCSYEIWLKVILFIFKHHSHRSDFNYKMPVIFFNFIQKSDYMYRKRARARERERERERLLKPVKVIKLIKLSKQVNVACVFISNVGFPFVGYLARTDVLNIPLAATLPCRFLSRMSRRERISRESAGRNRVGDGGRRREDLEARRKKEVT
jgi:hypothetical protein